MLERAKTLALSCTGLARLERATYRLGGDRSIQLSYSPRLTAIIAERCRKAKTAEFRKYPFFSASTMPRPNRKPYAAAEQTN